MTDSNWTACRIDVDGEVTTFRGDEDRMYEMYKELVMWSVEGERCEFRNPHGNIEQATNNHG